MLYSESVEISFNRTFRKILQWNQSKRRKKNFTYFFYTNITFDKIYKLLSKLSNREFDHLFRSIDFSIRFFHFLFSRILPCRANLLPSHGARIKRTRKRGSVCLIVLEGALDEWEEGGDAERGRIPEEEYAFAIPTTDFARGLGCGRSLDNARRKRRYEREEARFFSRSMPKGETSSPSVPGRRCTIEHQVADISGINFFERKNSFPFFFFFLLFSRDFTW